MTNLAEKYRPASFDDFRGSELVAAMLQKMVNEETLPNCMLFTGDKGCGKTSAARIISNEINGPGAQNLSYIEIDAASNSGVDNIRKLQENLMYTHPGNWRIVVIDEAHGLSTAAFNALLKVLEEPPARTTFILITTQAHSIPDTVKSRSMVFRFKQLSIPDIAHNLLHILTSEGITTVPPEVIVRIAQVSGGSMRSAIVLLQQVLQVDMCSVEIVNELSGFTVDTKDLMYAFLSGDLTEVESEVGNVFGVSNNIDNLILSLMSTIKEFHSSQLITNKQFLSCMTVMWSMRKIQKNNDSVSRTQIEAGMFAMFSQSFWNGEEGQLKKDDIVTDEQLEAMRA